MSSNANAIKQHQMMSQRNRREAVRTQTGNHHSKKASKNHYYPLATSDASTTQLNPLMNQLSNANIQQNTISSNYRPETVNERESAEHYFRPQFDILQQNKED